jgi:hypothetical protein
MLGLLARLVGGVTTPLIDRLTAASARLLRKLALFFVAAVCLVVVLIALTIAFDLWIASYYGPIAGALTVAGLYFAIGAAAVAAALLNGRKPQAKAAEAAKEARDEAAADRPGLDAQIDAFAAPLLRTLHNLGLRREQLAVLAGTSVAKQMGPLPLVGLAIVGGFLIGRMWGGLRSLVSTDVIGMLVKSGLLAGLFRAGDATDPEAEPDAEAENREAA